MKAHRRGRDKAKVRVAAKFAGRIHNDLRKSIDIKEIVEDFLNSTPSITITSDLARRWARHNVKFNDAELKVTLGKIYNDGYLFGNDSAKQEMVQAITQKAQPSLKDIKNVNWSEWKAGNKDAAKLLNQPKGLSTLMRSRGVTLQGINNTTADRIGTHLAYALSHGFSPSSQVDNILDILSPLREKIAKELGADLTKMMSDPERALMIAQTEMSRAVSVASRETYLDTGVELVEWITSDPCDTCAENSDVSPIPIDDEFPSGDTEPPAHPNCVCDLAPYMVDMRNIGEEALSIILGED